MGSCGCKKNVTDCVGGPTHLGKLPGRSATVIGRTQGNEETSRKKIKRSKVFHWKKLCAEMEIDPWVIE